MGASIRRTSRPAPRSSGGQPRDPRPSPHSPVAVARRVVAACAAAPATWRRPQPAAAPARRDVHLGGVQSGGDLHRPRRLGAGRGLRVLPQLRPVGSDIAGIHLFRNPTAASQDPACPDRRSPASEPLVRACRVDPRAARPRRQQPGDGHGRRPPRRVDRRRHQGRLDAVLLLRQWQPHGAAVRRRRRDHWVVAGNERLRLYLLDLPGGGTVAVTWTPSTAAVRRAISQAPIKGLVRPPPRHRAAPAPASASSADPAAS